VVSSKTEHTTLKGEEMKFTACKHLDFSDNYAAKKQVLGNDVVFWVRDVSYDPTLPSMVQFCKFRGRLNNPERCTQKRFAACGDYEEFEHDVPDESIAD
jgi:hypothetical protein